MFEKIFPPVRQKHEGQDFKKESKTLKEIGATAIFCTAWIALSIANNIT